MTFALLHRQSTSPRVTRVGHSKPTHSFFIQPKLNIGTIDHPLEREADAVADAVMREPAAPIAISNTNDEQISRACAKCDAEEEETLQAKARGSTLTASNSSFENEVSSARQRGGATMNANVRENMERRFNADFGQVRIHTDATSTTLANQINARAFTVGNDVFFGAGQYRPEAFQGQRLLAHELTHAIQQRSSNTQLTVRRKPLPDDDRDFLTALRQRGKPFLALKADDRARRIVEAGEIELTFDDKVALIDQMLSGLALNADEDAITKLIDSMTPQERKLLTKRRRTSEARLNRKFQGEEQTSLTKLLATTNEIMEPDEENVDGPTTDPAPEAEPEAAPPPGGDPCANTPTLDLTHFKSGTEQEMASLTGSTTAAAFTKALFPGIQVGGRTFFSVSLSPDMLMLEKFRDPSTTQQACDDDQKSCKDSTPDFTSPFEIKQLRACDTEEKLGKQHGYLRQFTSDQECGQISAACMNYWKANSKRLLAHEQGHVYAACWLAEKANIKLEEIWEKTKLKAESAGSPDPVAQADARRQTVFEEIEDQLMSSGAGLSKGMQKVINVYDAATDHGCRLSQSDWDSRAKVAQRLAAELTSTDTPFSEF